MTKNEFILGKIYLENMSLIFFSHLFKFMDFLEKNINLVGK